MSDQKPPVRITMIDQFNHFREVRQKAKENKPKGPPDLKALRNDVKSWDAKNRKP